MSQLLCTPSFQRHPAAVNACPCRGHECGLDTNLAAGSLLLAAMSWPWMRTSQLLGVPKLPVQYMVRSMLVSPLPPEVPPDCRLPLADIEKVSPADPACIHTPAT